MEIRDIVMVMIIPLLLMVMVSVFAQFDDSIDRTGLSSDAQTAINDTAEQAYSAFGTATILPIVIVGALIIGLLLKMFAF